MSSTEGNGREGFAEDSLINRMQMSITEITAQRATGSMPVDGNRQVHGLLHGGASAALAETVASLAAMAHAGDGNVAMGVDLNITHHRSVKDGAVHATATAVHLGRTTATYVVVVEDDERRAVASARLTCAIRAKSAQR